MDVRVDYVVQGESVRRCPKIAFIISVSFEPAIYTCEKHEAADIKLSFLIQKGF